MVDPRDLGNWIYFQYGGKDYRVSMLAYGGVLIVLPDEGRTVLNVTTWLESYPPQIGASEEVPHLFSLLSAEEVAEKMGGVLARVAYQALREVSGALFLWRDG